MALRVDGLLRWPAGTRSGSEAANLTLAPNVIATSSRRHNDMDKGAPRAAVTGAAKVRKWRSGDEFSTMRPITTALQWGAESLQPKRGSMPRTP